MLQVEWYQPSAGSFADTDFTYEAPSTSAGAFGTFEEEEPLLQGQKVWSLLRISC